MSTGEIAYTIAQAAVLLERSPHTLRSWDRNQSMPQSLRPPRNELGHRYWTPELIQQIKDWIVANDFHPGSGIAYHPSPEKLAQHIGKIRRAATERGDRPATGPLRDLIEEALDIHGVEPDDIIKMLPSVVLKINEAEGIEIHLDEALRTAGEVLSSRSTT